MTLNLSNYFPDTNILIPWLRCFFKEILAFWQIIIFSDCLTHFMPPVSQMLPQNIRKQEVFCCFNPLSANPTKWSNTLK